MRLDKTLYFILDYVEMNGEKREARVLPLNRNTNLTTIRDWFSTIKNNEGDVGCLDIIHLAESKKFAYDTCDAWNKTYKAENRFFGGY